MDQDDYDDDADWRRSNNSIDAIEIGINCRHIPGTDCRGPCLKLQGGNARVWLYQGEKGKGFQSWNVLSSFSKVFWPKITSVW